MITEQRIKEFVAQAHRLGELGLTICSSGNLSWSIGEKDASLPCEATLLFMPVLFSYYLTGTANNEYTSERTHSQSHRAEGYHR